MHITSIILALGLFICATIASAVPGFLELDFTKRNPDESDITFHKRDCLYRAKLLRERHLDERDECYRKRDGCTPQCPPGCAPPC